MSLSSINTFRERDLRRDGYKEWAVEEGKTVKKMTMLRAEIFRFFGFVFVCFIRVGFAAVIFQNPNELLEDINYDFIIAGGEPEWFRLINVPKRADIKNGLIGGTGGGVIASRLAQNPNVNVLVIEAGPSYVISLLFIPHVNKTSIPLVMKMYSKLAYLVWTTSFQGLVSTGTSL